MVRHLLVTNDFPPKVGGIQSYLWELWRRLPPEDVIVHTTPHEGAEAFDAEQDFTIVRSPEPWLLPQPVLTRRVNQLARDHDAALVILDPAVPAGLIGPHLDRPYGVVLHGAEVTIPGRLPITHSLLKRVLADGVGVTEALIQAVSHAYDVVLTVGGTGLAPDDRTPEMTRAIVDREVPGLAEVLRADGVARGVPTASLSRGVAGVVGGTLVVNLPGSVGGARDGASLLAPLLRHAVDQMAGGDH